METPVANVASFWGRLAEGLSASPSEKLEPGRIGTAQAARQQALHLARLLRSVLRGRPAFPFRYSERGAIASLSDYDG